jgi:hypothetical protein
MWFCFGGTHHKLSIDARLTKAKELNLGIHGNCSSCRMNFICDEIANSLME